VSLFVGRELELSSALDVLGSRNDGTVHDVVGVHGIGKSIFLQRLAEEARKLDRVEVFSIDMKRHGLGIGYLDDFGANATAPVLQETLHRSRELMALFAELPTQEFDAFRAVSRFQNKKTALLQAKNEVYIGRRSRVSRADLTVNIADDVVKQDIRETQRVIDDAFVEAWTEFTARRRVLITVDTFQQVADDEMGQWMIRLARRLPNTLVVLARTPSDHELSAESAGFQRVFLTNFTWHEVAEYLNRRIENEKLQAGMAEVVHTFTDGHPGGVTLIADLVIERGGAAFDPDSLRRILDRLPTDPDQRWAELVRLTLEAVREPILLRAVNAIGLTTTFDAPLLGELIGGDETEVSVIGEVIARLDGLRLLQQVPALSGSPSGRFRLHEFIRLSVAARLRALDPQGWVNLNRVITQHYFRRLRKWEDDPYGSYGAWYRFEDLEWQEYKNEWLRHSGVLTGERAVTRNRFTLVFLEAFWWWGCYIPFPFNRRLLEEWSRASAAWENSRLKLPVRLARRKGEDQQLLESLTFLLNNYPVGYQKPVNAPWDELRGRLLLIRRLCGLRHGATTALTAEERAEMMRTDAFITLFLAHTRRFLDPADQKAESYYLDAVTAFEEMSDKWTVAWLHYERADLALERRDLSLAIERARLCALSAEEIARLGEGADEWDHELLGNLHRVCADVYWLKHDIVAAAAGYGRAVAHAYWFQGDPHAPDEYTQQFYVEITLRAAERIIMLVDQPDGLELFITTLLREVPGVLLPARRISFAGQDTHAIRRLLFLAGPTEDELWTDDSSFMANWSVLQEDQEDPCVGLAYLLNDCLGG
jgi:hypothetical protein